MSLVIRSRVEGSNAILELTGTLTLGPTLQTPRETARQILSGHRLSEIFPNLAGVTAVDSAGLGELAVVCAVTVRWKCPVRVEAANSNVRQILELTRLDEQLR
jgi:anti-anti-sigma factor